MPGIQFTDFGVSHKESISSSEQRKNDVLNPLKKVKLTRAQTINSILLPINYIFIQKL